MIGAIRFRTADSETYAAVLLLTSGDFLLRRNTLIGFDLRHMCALVGNIMPERHTKLFAVAREQLRIEGAARDGHISHAVVEQVFCRQLGIDVDQYAVRRLPLAGMTGDGIAMIEMGMQARIALQLTGGPHAIQAQHGGDNSFNATSTNSTLNITPAGTTLAAPSIFGGTAVVGDTFIVATTVQTQSSGEAPNSAVAFFSNGTPLSGTVFYSPSPGSASSPASLFASISVSFSAAGSYAITATFAGDGNYSVSLSVPLDLILRYRTPNVSISATPSTVLAGTPVTLTAVVSSGAKGPAFTGTLGFFDAFNNQIPGNVVLTPGMDPNGFPTLQGTLTFTPSTIEVASAEYGGDSNYPAASDTTIVTVNVPDFNVDTNPLNVTVNVSAGASAQVTLQITDTFGYNGTVAFSPASCLFPPPETTCSFNPSTVTGPGTTQMTITTAAPHAAARTGPGIARGVRWTVGFGVMACALLAGASSERRRWRALPSLVVLGFLLALPNCGGGGGGGGNIDPGTSKGTYVVTVAGTSGSLTHTTTFQLVMQ
jgi:Bacterial Ig-like domain (group 3)